MDDPQSHTGYRPTLVAVAAAAVLLLTGLLAFRYVSPLLAAVAGLAAGVLIQRLAVRSPASWLPKLEAALAAAGAGQYSVSLTDDSRVPPQLIHSFNTLLAAMQERRTGLDALAAQLAALADELTERVHQLTVQAGGEAQVIQSAVAELSGSVEEVAGSSMEAAELSRQAGKGADEGKVSMTEALGSMDMLSGGLGNARQAMQQLDVHIESIGGVLGVIRGIAEQTNMLALNAAIEAARAGEQGRGFAVVADEVRNLAGRTQQSTQEIQSMIEGVQNGARRVVEVVVEGDNQAKVCEELIETACVSLAEISGEIASISTLNTQIDQLSARQREVVARLGKEMNDAVEQRRLVTAQSGLAEIADRVEELSKRVGSTGY